MILHTETIQLSLSGEQLLNYFKAITVQSYKPFSCGYTHSYELQNLPNFCLIEGVIVPPHSDGIAGYRPILMLHNPSNSYTVRGTSQEFSPQRKGMMILLDIEAQHEVHSRDPNGNFGAWSGLVWGVEGKPLMKKEWEANDGAAKAKEEFIKLCRSIFEERLELPNPVPPLTNTKNHVAFC